MDSQKTFAERLKYVIRLKGLKYKNVAQALKITESSVSRFCSGQLNPSDRTISDFCEKFGVNETWLRTGDGDMFAGETREQSIASITAGLIQNDSSDGEENFRLKFIKALVNMDEDQLRRVLDFLTKLVE